jgi:hypothetical protein
VFTVARMRRVLPWPSRMLSIAATLLVDSQLWERHTSGFAFKNWLDHQRSKAQQEQDRQDRNERQRQHRARHAGREITRESAGSNAVTKLLRDGSTPASRNGSRALTVMPALPSPSLPGEEKESESRARSCACPPEDSSGEFTADRQAALFARCFRELRGDVPNMAGKATEDFHDRVVDAARSRSCDPEELFLATLERWLSGELNERERRVPYACFATAWGGLLERRAANAARVPSLADEANEALKANDFERFNQLQAQLARANGGKP